MTDHATRAREIAKEIFADIKTFEFWRYLPDSRRSPFHVAGWIAALEKPIAAALTRAAEEARQVTQETVDEIGKKINSQCENGCGAVARDLMLEAFQLQAAQSVWSNKAPGVTGWFFYRETNESPCRPIEVVMANYTGPLQPWVRDGSERRPLACMAIEGGEWAPIPLPREA